MCQLYYLDEMGARNSSLDDKIQFVIRKYRWYRKLVLRTLRRKHDIAISSEPTREIQPGDMVRVRTKAEIGRTFNKMHKTKGCTFQTSMFQHCGREYKVLKRVNYFYDEVRKKVCKCNGIFLLEGVQCDGETAYLRQCQRDCYYFWQEAWLEKI